MLSPSLHPKATAGLCLRAFLSLSPGQHLSAGGGAGLACWPWWPSLLEGVPSKLVLWPGLVRGGSAHSLRWARATQRPSSQSCQGASAAEPAWGSCAEKLWAWVHQGHALGGGLGHWAPCPLFLPGAQGARGRRE